VILQVVSALLLQRNRYEPANPQRSCIAAKLVCNDFTIWPEGTAAAGITSSPPGAGTDNISGGFFMRTISIVVFSAAATLLSASASGQTTSQPTTGGGMSSSMSSSNMTCQQMMDQANSQMSSVTDQTKKDAAMKHMDMAKTAMAHKHESSCKTHVQQAMDAMK